MTAAARLHDPVQHSNALIGLLAGAALGVAFGVFVVATGGAGLVVGAAIIGGAAATGAGIGEVVGSLDALGGSVTGGISSGSPNTKVNSRNSARATVDTVDCSGTPPSLLTPTHVGKHIAQGSATVLINLQPASRVDDKIECGSKIVEGSPNVIIGGPTATTLEIDSEVPGYIHAIVLVVGIGAAVVLAGPVVAAAGVALSMAGGYGGQWLAARLGLSEDWQKIFGLGGSLLGGYGGMRGGVRPAQLLGSRVGGPWGGFIARGYKVPYAARPLDPSNASPATQGRVNDFISETNRTPDYSMGNRDPALWTGKGARDAAVGRGRGTLEDTPTGQATETFGNSIKNETNWAGQKPIWDNSSAGYSHNIGRNYGTVDPVTGQPLTGPNAGKPVEVYVSDAANPNSVYYTTERPILQQYGVNVREVNINTKPQLPVSPVNPSTQE